VIDMLQRRAFLALLAAGSAGVLAPISFTPKAGIAPAAAECATCCRQDGATCVICGTDKCVAHTGYYEGKMGPNGCVAGQET
jgi:hypothetical protein